MSDLMPAILKGDARALPLPDESVDLIVTSPPYFGLRSYTDDGEHYTGQLGAEATRAEFIASLIECTAEMVRVLKPSGSIFVNLGDKYPSNNQDAQSRADLGVRPKSLALLPERYRIAAVDELGLIARAVIVWSKPNGLPESTRDRVRRSHEDWVHLTRSPKYYSAVDEIREPHARASLGSTTAGLADAAPTPLGKLPGSVWEIAAQPLKVPAELGVDHFAAFPMEWPRRLILGWSPREVCTVCGEGRRPVTERVDVTPNPRLAAQTVARADGSGGTARSTLGRAASEAQRTITGYACACPDTTAPATPGVVLDPFGGTGTTALVATMHGRIGLSVDLSADYVRLAEWRCADAKQRNRATEAKVKPLRVVEELPALDLSGVVLDPVLALITAAQTSADLVAAITGTPAADWTPAHSAAVDARMADLGLGAVAS